MTRRTCRNLNQTRLFTSTWSPLHTKKEIFAEYTIVVAWSPPDYSLQIEIIKAQPSHRCISAGPDKGLWVTGLARGPVHEGVSVALDSNYTFRRREFNNAIIKIKIRNYMLLWRARWRWLLFMIIIKSKVYLRSRYWQDECRWQGDPVLHFYTYRW